jgi:DNA-binding NarL/FixJ family response regulator
MSKPTVILADDHTMVAEALRKVLEPKYEVMKTVSDGRSLVEAALALKPDVIVLDVAMPLLNGLEAGRQLKQQLPNVKLIFLTFHEEPGLVMKAFQAGASGYLVKRSAASELTLAIDQVLKGVTYVSSLIAGQVMESLARNPKSAEQPVELTARQREVVQLLAEGHSMKELASILNISVSTVAAHKYNIMDSLQIKSNADLFQYALKHGIIS